MEEETMKEAYKRIIKAGLGIISTEYRSLENLKTDPPFFRQVSHVILDPGRGQSSESILPLKLLMAPLEIDIEFLDTHQLIHYEIQPTKPARSP